MKAETLKRRADAAAQVRRYDTDPDVVAYRLERRAVLGTGLVWAGIVLGLGFTVPNVQQFVAGDAEPWSIVWITAWLLDVMVSLPLIGVLVLEQATTRYEVPLGVWARVLKWGSLSATYAMNTWHAWAGLDAAGILVHSVPPLVVFVCAEVLPTGRERITEAVHKAAASLPRLDEPAASTTVESVPTEPEPEPVPELPSSAPAASASTPSSVPVTTSTSEPTAPAPSASPPVVEPADPLLGYAAQVADAYRQTHGQPIPAETLRHRLGVADAVAARLHAQLV
ncbi:hypothetical protein GCM10027294_32750 [Marinactinospora endophytica]